jgi:hypothetical protein
MNKKVQARKILKEEHLPLERTNFVIIAIGVLLISGGYLSMMEGSVEGFWTLTLAPILLVLGYCVVVPIGILYRKGMFSRKREMPSTVQEQP